MSTVTYKNGLTFTYTVLRQSDPSILRGDFSRDNKKIGLALESNRPSMEDAVDAILRYARLMSDNIYI